MTGEIPTILFVDDEQPILDGLRRKLMQQEDDWQMLFANSGTAALEILAAQPVDVVIADMRMPGMDGAALLDEVRRNYPATARFILSGFSERETTYRVLGPAHQYFVKPCDTGQLAQAVERTLSLRRRLQSTDLLTLISGAKGIPALPQALSDLFEQFKSHSGSAAEVARIISTDIGMTAQVLKLVNSAYFFVPTNVADVLQAVRLLGFELIRSVALLAGVFEAFKAAGADMEALVRLCERSMMIGAVARRIAESEKLEAAVVDQSQCAGMLAHIGSLILFANRAPEMSKLQRELDASGGEIIAAEQRIFGASHPELGGCLLSLWGFGNPVVEAVFFHHSPGQSLVGQSEGIGPTAIVHAAQHLVKPGHVGQDIEANRRMGLDTDYLRRIRVADRIDAWGALAAKTNKDCL